MLLAFVFILRNDLVHPDGSPDAMAVDTREDLLAGQRAFQEPDLYFSTVGELHTSFQQYHIIFYHSFTDCHILRSSL
jgi:hypothetical protein